MTLLPRGVEARGHLDEEVRSRAGKSGSSRVIVRFDDGDGDAIVKKVGGKSVRHIGDLHVFEVDNDKLHELGKHGDVSLDRIARSNLYRVTGTIGSEYVNTTLKDTGKVVGVAVIDSGIAYHDDLFKRGNSLVAWVDFVNGKEKPYDDFGHGTHISGIISGDGYDSNGRHRGVASDARLLALKVLNDKGAGYVSDIIAAINWTVAHRKQYNARVINISASAPVLESYLTDPLCAAVRDAVEAGITVVASAGNLGRNPATGAQLWGGIGAPANCPMALTVGASSTEGDRDRSNDIMASFSSRGPTRFDLLAKPDIAAPATGVVAPIAPNSRLYHDKSFALFDGAVKTPFKPYLALSGTSQAAAVVSGTVALMIAANPMLTPNLVKATLQYTAEFKPQFNALEQGAGFLNAKGAVTLSKYFITTKAGAAYPSDASWSRTVIWGNLRLSGGVIAPNASAYAWDVQWGARKTPRNGHIVWGDNCANAVCAGATRTGASIWNMRRGSLATGSYYDDNIVWGNYGDDNIVWGNYWDDNIVWGNYADDNIVWGNYYDDNIVWGNAGDDNIVWGNAEREDNIVWGNNYGDDNIVWGNYADDNIVWGNAHDDENIVWGNYNDDNIVWGNYSDDNIVWGNAGDDNIVWGNYYDDNIVWGNYNDDNIVWGNAGDDNIVWGNYADENIVWGNYSDDNIVWGNSADENIVWGN
jgi:serine protease AprX